MSKHAKSPTLIREIFESRYRRGYRYLDRCGELMLVLEELLPQRSGVVWMMDSAVPTGARIACPEKEGLVVIDTEKVIVQFEQDTGTDVFDRVCETVVEVISTKLVIEEFVRYGHRISYMIPTDEVDEAERLSARLVPFKDWPSAPPDGFEFVGAESQAKFETPDGERGFRIQLDSVQRFVSLEVDERLKRAPRTLHTGQRKALIAQQRRLAERARNPNSGVRIDIDCYATRLDKNEGLPQFLSSTRASAIQYRDAILQPGVT